MEKFHELVLTYTPYLEDIRRRIYVTAILFLVFFVVGFFSTAKIIHLFVTFFDISNVVIATTSPFQFADLSIDIGLLFAFAFSCPIAVFQIFMFLRPALTKKERWRFFFTVPVTLMLFIGGFLYGFFIMYYALIVLAGINTSLGIQNIWDIGLFLTQIILTSTLLGVLFQFPIVMTYVIKIGFISVQFLKQKRRIAIFVIFLFTTLLPPTDGLSLLAMALPLIVLYEMTILLNSKYFRAKKILINNL